jgi:uncharacterized protein
VDLSTARWLNSPAAWHAEADRIEVTTAPEGDFWRITHYGFIHDSGHFLGIPVSDDFVAEVEVAGQYRDQYDQAGLMVRQDESNWLKTGIEYFEGIQQVSAVATREFSDWSVVPLRQSPPSIRLRLTRQGDFIQVAYSLDGQHYDFLRVAYLPPSDSLLVGPMCASPTGQGFTATFTGLSIRPLDASDRTSL